MFRIQPNMRKAQAYLERLEKRDLPRVIGRSLDRTAKSVKSEFSTRLRKRINLRKAVVDAAIRTRRAGDIQSISAMRLGRAWAELIVSGSPIPLRDFDAKMTRKGVTYRVSRGKGRRRYMAGGQPGFIVPGLGGHVFVRKGPEPPGPETVGIRKVFGPSLPQFLLSKREQVALIKHAQEFWAREVERNARFALQRRGAL